MKPHPTALVVLSIAALALGSFFWFSGAISERSIPARNATEWREIELETRPLPVDTSAESDQALLREATRDPLVRAQSPVRDLPVWKLLRDGNAWQLMSEHWPKAKRGVADSQYIVHSTMQSCVGYHKRFEGKHLSEVQAEFSSHDDPKLFRLNAKIWKRCGRIYELWDRFEGWRAMLGAAASNGQPVAMVLKGGDLASDAETFEKGVRLIKTALLTRDAFAVASMSGVLTRSNIYGRSDVDRTTRDAWVLAACKLGLDCSVPVEGCEIVPCGIRESAREVLTRELGDGDYYIVNQKAERIYEAIASGDIDSLDIAADLR